MISHGIKLSLIAAKSEYPRDALIQVAVRIDNVSDRQVTLREFSVWNPEVRVEAGNGEMVFRSGEVLLEPFSHGPAPGRFMLAPGESIDQQVHVILRAERLHPEVILIEDGSSTVVTGQPVSVALYPEEAPAYICTATRSMQILNLPSRSTALCSTRRCAAADHPDLRAVRCAASGARLTGWLPRRIG